MHIWKSELSTVICNAVDFVSSASCWVQPIILLSDKDEIFLSHIGKVAFSNRVSYSGLAGKKMILNLIVKAMY